MILYYNVGMLCLYGFGESAEHGRLSDAGHILQAYLLCTGSYKLVGNAGIIFHRMHRRCGDAECSLRCHSGFGSPVYAWDDVAHIVKSAEDARDVHALRVLNLIHKLPYIVGYRIHSQCVQSSVEHMGLYSRFVERSAESPYGVVRVFARQQVYLFEGASVCFHTGKTSHVDDDRSYALQLVFTWLELP